jgi:tRNA G10  N-methylase Trm11
VSPLRGARSSAASCSEACSGAVTPGVVLDPFCGSGTTALVARRLGRKSVGVELNPEYAALCARRLQQLSLFAGEA